MNGECGIFLSDLLVNFNFLHSCTRVQMGTRKITVWRFVVLQPDFWIHAMMKESFNCLEFHLTIFATFQYFVIDKWSRISTRIIQLNRKLFKISWIITLFACLVVGNDRLMNPFPIWSFHNLFLHRFFQTFEKIGKYWNSQGTAKYFGEYWIFPHLPKIYQSTLKFCKSPQIFLPFCLFNLVIS